MLILALDTTTRAGSVAVVRGDDMLAVIAGDPARTHGERLPADIDRALQVAGVARHELQLLAVASGPGAFTGLRIGLAAVQGLAMVLGVPTVGVSALEALALAALERHTARFIAPWMDAQRGEVFAAQYVRDGSTAPLTLAHAPTVGRPADVLQRVPPSQSTITVFIGDGAARYRTDIERYSDRGAQVVDAPAALAAYVARLGRVLAERGEAGPPHALQPLYVRRSDAELQRHHTT